MKKFLTMVTLICSLPLVGCGGGDTGPADPSETPQVSEEEVQKSMTESMPPEAQKMYENYKGGGGPK